MADIVKQISIRQNNGEYVSKDIGVDIENVDGLDDALDTKQDTLIPGDNITIVNNVISSTGGGGGGSYSRLTPQQGGQNLSLVWDGDMYNWNDTYRTNQVYNKTQVDNALSALESELESEIDDIVVNDAKLIIQQNGVTKQQFTANQSGNDVAADIITDEWVNTTAVTPNSSLQVAFDNLDDSYSYELFFDDDNSTLPHTVPHIEIASVTKAAGTNTNTVKLTFTLVGATASSTKCFLRKIK